MNGDGWRWHLEAPDHVARTIAVVEASPADVKAREARDERKRERGAVRVPFGFARALVADELERLRGLCGHPHRRDPERMGGCTLALGHAQAAHRYDPQDPGPIRDSGDPRP